MKTYEVTELLAAGTNTLALTHGYLGRNRRPQGDCVSLIVAAINLPEGAAPPPPPANNPPVVTGTPVITVNSPAPILVQADASDADGDPLAYTVAIDGAVVSASSIPGGSSPTLGTLAITNAFGLGQHTVVFTANDGVSSGSFTTVINVIDITPPIIAIENIIVPSDLGRTTAVVDFRNRVSVIDDFPGVTWIADRLPGSAFAIGITTVTLTAVDASGNRAQRSFSITVTDCLPPIVNCPPDMLRETDRGASNAVVRWTTSAMDNLPGCTVTCTPSSGSVFGIGITTVVCAGRDAAGNTANCMFTVMIVDREPPVLTVPANIVVVTDPGQDTAVVNYTASVVDNVPGATVTCTPPPGSTFPLGTNLVTCIASDAAGNTVTHSFTIAVVDREPPIITTPITLIVPTDPGQSNAAVSYTVHVSDNLPGSAIVCTPPSGATFALGTTPVTCVANDSAGNRATNSFVIVVEDREPPVITVPANITVPNDPGLYSAMVNFEVAVSDNTPGATVNCVPASGSVFPVGTTAVVCTAADSAGSKATNSFTVTVEDREKPALTVPADFTRSVEPGQTGAAVTYSVTASDNSGSATITCTALSGARFGLGITLVVCTASDAAGNAATRGFAVTLVDSANPDIQPPLITVPDNFVVPTDPGRNNAVVNYAVSVSDNQPGATLACLPPSGAVFPMGTTAVVCTASDTTGNRATNSFTVTVEDRETPVLTVPANLSMLAEPGQSNVVVEYTATATDNSGSVAVICVPASGTAFPVGVTTVTCTAMDDSGNVATGSFTVTVTRHVQPPDYGCIITSKPVLWPPCRKMVPVSVWMNFDKKTKIKFSSARIVSVTSNEPETGLDASDIGPDWEITDAKKLKLRLRAERDPNGSGRVYTIVVEGADPQGNLYVCQTTVTVPIEKPSKKKKK